MQTWCVIASGESLKDAEIALVQEARADGRIAGVIAVSNVGLDKAPWADMLVSYDSAWWRQHPEALEFKGRKFCKSNINKANIFNPSVYGGCNSGLMAMEIARDICKADRILILGFDMHGTHYFGPHGSGLKNTTDVRFKHHIRQFNQWKGPEVINCNPESSLKKFAFGNLREIL